MSKWVTVLGLVGMANFANASTIIDKITGDDIFAGMKRTTPNAECANFAGKWKGVCQHGDKKQDVNFELTQDGCDYIGVKDKVYPIGGVADFGITTPATKTESAAIGRATVAFVWNTDKSALVIDVLGTRKYLGSTKDLEAKSGSADLKIVANKLIMSWNEGGTAKQVCEFDKQP